MHYNSRIKYVLALFVAIYSCLTSTAQREKNYIYLFDCTGSMRTNKLWEAAKNALDKNIKLRASIRGSYFSVIPFGDNPYEIISFSDVEYLDKKQTVIDALEKYILQAKYTNISDVLKSGFEKTDRNKDNEIYLFTDGMPNNGDTPQKVAHAIKEWCSSHHNAKFFYVALTKGVINPIIKQAIDACEDALIVQCENGIVPVFANIATELYTNLEELDKTGELSFSIPGNYNLASTANDDLFDFHIVDGKALNGKIKVKVLPKGGLTIDQLHQRLQGNERIFSATIESVDRNFVIVNPNVDIHVSDKIPSKLTLAKSEDELLADGIKWYDSFLWSDATPDRKIVWDLKPLFKNELPNSRLTLKVRSNDGLLIDYHVWYNGQPLNKDSTIEIIPNNPALLEVQFDHNATTGKRYFSLVPMTLSDLNVINDKPAEIYKGTSLRTEYNVEWNPLKTFLFWLGIIILAGILLWLIILKRIFFPTIRLGKITITGPDTYYYSKRIKGARKIIMTSKRKSQNMFSRIFTGEIRYIRADYFSSEISIVAVGGKKKVRLRPKCMSNSIWEISPSSIFGQYDEGLLFNQNTKDKSKIEFS